MVNPLRSLVKMFSLLLRRYPAPPTADDIARSDEWAAKAICARLSRGNVSLQLGRFVTEGDLERLRSKVSAYDFKD
jgi:hypothetical protein